LKSGTDPDYLVNRGLSPIVFVGPDLVTSEGFFSKLLRFGSSSDKTKGAQRYRVSVKSAAAASASQVMLQTNDGKPETRAAGAKILKLLSDQLK
jgi:outer membrane protein assembly factor BamC